MNLTNLILNYLFPFKCSVCTNLTATNNNICADCWFKFKFTTKPYCMICCTKFQVNINEDIICGKCISSKPKFDMMRSLLEFSSDTKSLVYKFKYNDKTNLAKFFAKLIYQRFKNDLQDLDIIVPVPMHKFKRIFRNYNPPQVLACELSKYFHIPCIPELLFKKHMTKSQVGLNQLERVKNISGSFGLHKNFNLENKNILLVDDVLTTGATSNECSKILKKAKVKTVKLVTIARVNLESM